LNIADFEKALSPKSPNEPQRYKELWLVKDLMAHSLARY
jgi:hypothetical protein